MNRRAGPLIFCAKKRWIGMENRDDRRDSLEGAKRSPAGRSR